MANITQADLVAALQTLLGTTNTSIVQPQAGSPNNATNQMAVDVFTIPAGQQVIFNGTFTWFEIILTTADTIAVQAYQQGGQQNLYLGIEVVLDVPSNQMRFTNYGSSSSTFSLMHGAGKQPAIDHRLIFNGADILNVTVANTAMNPVPVSVINAPVSKVGGTAFGPISASGIAIPASAGKTIVLRTAVLEVSGSGQAFYVVTDGAGGQIFGVVTVLGGTNQESLKFPIQTAVGDTINLLQVAASGTVSATLSGTFDYV